MRQKVHPLGGIEGRISSVLRKTADAPFEDDAHFHGLPASVADALEGDSHFDGVALCVDLSRRIPDDVDAKIFLVSLKFRVSLDAQRVDVKRIEGLLIVECVEVDTNPIFGPDRVPSRDGGFDLVRLAVVAAEGEVEILAVVRIVDDRVFLHVLAVVRVIGLESRLMGSIFPNGVIEDAVDDGRHIGFIRLERLEFFCG